MQKIKIFRTTSDVEALEDEVNEFLAQDDIVMIDIKTTSTMAADNERVYWSYEIVVIYE